MADSCQEVHEPPDTQILPYFHYCQRPAELPGNTLSRQFCAKIERTTFQIAGQLTSRVKTLQQLAG